MSQQNLTPFSIPGRLSFSAGESGWIKANISHTSGSTCEIYLYGAHITSWKTAGGLEQLFMSSRAVFAEGKAIRGGIPLIWPQFNNRGTLPAHGFARNNVWEVRKSEIASNNDVVVTLGLKENEKTLAIFPHSFDLELKLVLGQGLRLCWSASNTGDKSFPITSAFHSYFRVKDIASTSVLGLQGVTLEDFLKDNARSTETRSEVTISEFTDRAYLNAPDALVIKDGARRNGLSMKKKGFADAVVWNPWVARSKEIADLGPEDFKNFICVEAANMAKPSELAPQATQTLEMDLVLL